MADEKRVLICCSNYWNSPIQVGDHHLARQFVREGWRVGFISTPISPLHFLKRPCSEDLKDRFSSYWAGGISDCAGKLWSYVPGAIVVPQNMNLLRNRWLYRNWQKLTVPNLKKTVAAQGFNQVDLIYFRDPKQAFWLRQIKHRASVYRIADNDSGFLAYNDEVRKLERELAKSVDAVCYTAHGLERYVSEFDPRYSFYLPNGVNFHHFSGNNDGPPLEYGRMKKPIVVYVGSVDYWFDFNLINYAARELPAVSFVIIGPELLAVKRLDPRPNIHILGRRGYDCLPPYLRHADIGIIPFNHVDYKDLVDSINPIKMYEYMASGLPVIAPKWKELSRINSPVRYYDCQEDFVIQIREILSAKIDKKRLVEYAGKLDWAVVFDTLKKHLNGIHPELFE